MNVMSSTQTLVKYICDSSLLNLYLHLYIYTTQYVYISLCNTWLKNWLNFLKYINSLLSSYSISVNCHAGNIFALFSIFAKFQDTFLNLGFFLRLLLPIAISWPLLLPTLAMLHCCPTGLREAHRAGNRLLYIWYLQVCGLVTIQTFMYSAFVLGKSPLNLVKLMKLMEMHLFKNSVLWSK